MRPIIYVQGGSPSKRMMRLLGANANAAVGRGMLSAALRIRTVVVASTMDAPPASSRGARGAFNTGFYAKAWKSQRERLAQDWVVHVYNKAAYAGVIEYGRRPGATRPPLAPIAAWAQRKLGLPYDKARSVAFVIARNIKRRGLKPREVLTGSATTQKMSQIVTEEVDRALRAALGRP